MRRLFLGPLAGLLALGALPATAAAASSSGTAMIRLAGADASAQPEGEGDDEDLVIIDDDEMEGGGDAPPADGDGDGDVVIEDDGGDDLDIFGDEGTETAAESEESAPDENSEEEQIKAEMGLITVVQRQRMLKKKRFELQPQFGITVNDPYVRHYTLGAQFDYWLTNRMALGLVGTGLIGAKTPRYDNIRRQEGLLLTANQVLWQANLNFTYNFIYGKIAIFNRALLHWEAGASIGGGVMQTRVIPRYESLHKPFNNFTGGGVVGFHARTYLPRVNWLAFDLGVRYWLFPDRAEPDQRGPDTDAGGVDLPELDSPEGAKNASSLALAHNVTFFVGASFFFPTSFDYTTPR